MIGSKEFNIIGKRKTYDMIVLFPHRTIQECLAALYFILMINAGETIESLLGSDPSHPIFLINQLLCYFCCYFLSDRQNNIPIKNSEVYGHLVWFISKIIDTVQFDDNDTLRVFQL